MQFLPYLYSAGFKLAIGSIIAVFQMLFIFFLQTFITVEKRYLSYVRLKMDTSFDVGSRSIYFACVLSSVHLKIDKAGILNHIKID